MTSIHYFPRYSQRENFVTNNSLLLLSRLYEFNRFKFAKLLGFLCAESEVEAPDIGLQFSQQIGTAASIVDGYISQRSFYVAVETKLGETFHIDQLKRHLSIFRDGREQQYLLLLSKSESPLTSAQQKALNEALPKGVDVLQASFETLINYVKTCLSEFDEEMLALVLDFEAFCSSLNLLSTDRHTIFIPPCSRSYKENIKYRLYYCPSTWSRRKAKYLGIYANRAVRAIGEIKTIVACNVDPQAQTVDVLESEGDALTTDGIQRILGVAEEAFKNNGWDLTTNTKFYLCSDMAPTDFKKSTSGGIMGHRYLDLKDVLKHDLPNDLPELASQLRSRAWK